MANYLLYDIKMIDDDSCMESFAKSLLKNIDRDYEIHCNEYDSDEFKDAILKAVYDSIQDDLSRTDIDYQELMKRFAKDIGQLLYDMEKHSYDLSSITISFLDDAQQSFEMFICIYIEIHFEELEKICLGQ